MAALVAALWFLERDSNRGDALETAELRLETSVSTASELLEYRVDELNKILSGVLSQDAVAKYFEYRKLGQHSQAEQMRASIENSGKRLFLLTPNLQSIELYDSEGERFLSVADRTPDREPENVSDLEWYNDARTELFSVSCVGGGFARISRMESLLTSNESVTGSIIVDIGRIAEPIFGFSTKGTEGIRARLECQHDQLVFGLGTGRVTGERIRNVAPQPFCGGELIFEQSRESALAGAKRSEGRGLVIAVLTLFVLLIMVWAGLRKIVLQPASRLLEVIQAFERGEELPSKPSEEDLGDELAKLDVAFRGAIECERRSSNSLLELNQTLEGRVTERTQELAQARDQALAASRTKSAFLANMSHEIRTPMNGVIGMLDLLMTTELNGEQNEFADTARSSAGSLLAVINDVLDFSKIEAGRLDLEQREFVPAKTIDEVFHLLSIAALQKGLVLTSEIPQELSRSYIGDSTRLRQVLTNLVSNAIKFTARGQIKIGAQIQEESKTETIVYFEVTDSGIGVPLENQAAIFDVFSQADNSTTRKFGGTGLGLSICKNLVELMGGEIGVDSKPGEFSKFWFTICFSRELATDAAAATTSTTMAELAADSEYLHRTTPGLFSLPSESRRLLLAEDNPVNQLVATRTLERLGYEVSVAENGLQALKFLREETFGLVLMDCQMPELDGYQTTATIRRGEAGRSDLPVIAMTANAMQGDRERCLEAGMDDYLSKPIDTDALAEKLAYWLGERRPLNQ